MCPYSCGCGCGCVDSIILNLNKFDHRIYSRILGLKLNPNPFPFPFPLIDLKRYMTNEWPINLKCALMSRFNQMGAYRDSMEMFDRMDSNSIDSVALLIAIHACGHTNERERGFHLLKKYDYLIENDHRLKCASIVMGREFKDIQIIQKYLDR